MLMSQAADRVEATHALLQCEITAAASAIAFGGKKSSRAFERLTKRLKQICNSS